MLGKPLTEVVAEARKYAETEYAVALMKGNSLSDSENRTVVQNLQRLTGLSADYLKKSNLRPVIFKYCQELLRSDGMVIGRFDSRYKGAQQNLLAEDMERDPSHHPTIAGCFSTCINDYLARELNVTTTLPYEVLTGRVWPWDFSNVQNEYLNVSTSLAHAMVTNPDLRVWVLNGYYDLATPFFGTEYTFTHMNLPANQPTNVAMTYYQAGHMMYLLHSELIAMKKDARSWFK
jgi:carboxypeptidase C (cathepsin A)